MDLLGKDRHNIRELLMLSPIFESLRPRDREDLLFKLCQEHFAGKGCFPPPSSPCSRGACRLAADIEEPRLQTRDSLTSKAH